MGNDQAGRRNGFGGAQLLTRGRGKRRPGAPAKGRTEAPRDDGVREYSDNLQDVCVRHCDKDILDHRTAVIEYESRTVACAELEG
jgi:hypothetical protein